MGRTDDLVRTWYHLDYTFLQDVTYDRLALFQMAADDYGDNGFALAAWGNAAGLLDQRTVTDHKTTGYASASDRGLPLTGASPWVMLYDNRRIDTNLPEEHADVAFVVRSFRAEVGGVVLETPSINVNRTNNGGSQLGIELGLPFQPDASWCGAACGGKANFIPAGSRVRATVEYLVLPADKSRYYGTSDYLTATPAEEYRTWEMARRQAADGALSVEALAGTVEQVHPVQLEAAEGSLAADFTLTGGLGFVPVTVSGLARHDGWRLEQRLGTDWIPVDQSVAGNDYWQARFDDTTGRYALTWNVPNRGENRYRVVWRP
jgi:hypothetical protein